MCLIHGFPNLGFMLVIIYNISVTWSLYNLVIFWKCLNKDLRPFNPWGKFLCVNAVTFVSFWQSMIMAILDSRSIFNGGNAGFVYQNGLLCVEMVGFAILHLLTFPCDEYLSVKMPNCGRMNYIYAVRDCFSGRDLKLDFGQTMSGHSYYNCRNFDPTAESVLVAKAEANSRLSRITQGLRFANQGQGRYWISYGSTNDRNEGRRFLEIEEPWTDSVTANKYLPTEPNYPVSVDLPAGHRNSLGIQDLRRDINTRASVV